MPQFSGVVLHHYEQVIKRDPSPLDGLPTNTRHRYRNAEFPAVFTRWLIKNPDVLIALAEDAKAAHHSTTEHTTVCSEKP